MTAVQLANIPRPPDQGNPFPTPWGPGPRPTAARLVLCPYCGGPVPGLLAGCTKPACRTADLDDDRAFERYADQ